MTEKPEKKENNRWHCGLRAYISLPEIFVFSLIFIGWMAWSVIFYKQQFSVNVGGSAPAKLYEFYATELEKSLDAYQQNLMSAQNYLMIWGAVLAIVFLIFSVLGLYKVDEKLSEAEEKRKEILRQLTEDAENFRKNQESFWETLLAGVSADKMIPSGEIGAFHSSSYRAISNSLGPSIDVHLKAYIKMELGHALKNEGQVNSAIKEYTDALALIEKSSSVVMKTLLYLRRGWAYGEKSSRNREGNNQLERVCRGNCDDLNSALHDLDKALELAWDDRMKSYICHQKGFFI